jgi:hypothetical protein
MKTDNRVHNSAAHLKKLPQQKKKPITIYEAGEDIDKLGGIEVVRQILKEAFLKHMQESGICAARDLIKQSFK